MIFKYFGKIVLFFHFYAIFFRFYRAVLLNKVDRQIKYPINYLAVPLKPQYGHCIMVLEGKVLKTLLHCGHLKSSISV